MDSPPSSVSTLSLHDALPIYLSIVIDRAAACPVVIASAAGGMDIEEVAASHPEQILREYIDPGTGIVPFQARKLDRKSTRLNSSHLVISYAVFCLKKKKITI